MNVHEFQPVVQNSVRNLLTDALLLELSCYEDDNQVQILAWLTKLHGVGIAQFMMPANLAQFHERISNDPVIQEFTLGFSERAEFFMYMNDLGESFRTKAIEKIAASRALYSSDQMVLNRFAANSRACDMAELSELMKSTPWVFWIYLALSLGVIHAAYHTQS